MNENPVTPRSDTASVSAAILAGGQARRFHGIDKSALAIGPHRILDRQLAVLRALSLSTFIVSDSADRFASTGVRVVPDHVSGRGALGGLHTALITAPTDRVLVLACDMPFLTPELLTALLASRNVASRSAADVVVPRDARGRHPLCAVYARDAASHLNARLEAGERRVRAAIEGLVIEDVDLDTLGDGQSPWLLTNVNTPADYATALASGVA